MIAARDLTFAYPGGFRLRVPAWDVPAGARAAVVGPSGCGKSTLLDLVAGAKAAASGSLTVDGQALGALSDAARRRWRLRRVGFVFQDFPLVGHLSARDNALLPYRLGGDLRLDDAVRARADALLDELGLAGLGDRRPSALSLGERQRVALARALITEPALLLADEPTTGLDPARRDAVMDLLEAAVAARGLTLVVVTHDPAVRERAAQVLELPC